jgi:hypothetical protein
LGNLQGEPVSRFARLAAAIVAWDAYQAAVDSEADVIGDIVANDCIADRSTLAALLAREPDELRKVADAFYADTSLFNDRETVQAMVFATHCVDQLRRLVPS